MRGQRASISTVQRVVDGASGGERAVDRRVVGLADPGVGAVGEQHPQAVDAVRRAAVDGGAHAGRVVADHAAERRAAGRRGVGPEAQAVLADGGVEVGLDDAGLHAGEPRVGVDRQDRVEPRDVEDDARADRLPGEAGAGAAHGQRRARVAADLERERDVLDRAGDHDALRDDPVDGGVGGVRVERGGVGSRLALEPSRETLDCHPRRLPYRPCSSTTIRLRRTR